MIHETFIRLNFERKPIEFLGLINEYLCRECTMLVIELVIYDYYRKPLILIYFSKCHFETTLKLVTLIYIYKKLDHAL